MLVGKRIKEMRLAKGLSQQELGDLIGVTKVSICGYESGSRTPSLETFALLSEVFGTSTDYLLGRELPVLSEKSKSYLGAISEDDVDLIAELKHYPSLYEKMTKDAKRYICLINKKMR